MVIYYVILLSLFSPSVSWGYVDPGSISIILQVVLAFVLGGVITLRGKIKNGIRRLLGLFSSKWNRSKKEGDE